MNNKKTQFFDYLGFTKKDFDELIARCPGIMIAETDTIIKCVYTLLKHGFPLEELEYLIKVNPLILLDSPNNLDKHILALGENPMEKLKQNPKLI